MPGRYHALMLAAALTVFSASSALAALDTPTLTYVQSGHGKLVLDVTAGASGTPSGFMVYWMTQADYDGYGDMWPSSIAYPTLHWASFTGSPTLNTFNGTVTSYVLAPFQTARIEIGDLADEDASAVTTNSPGELEYTEVSTQDYQVCAYAVGGTEGTRSTFSVNAAGSTTLVQNCTFTVGYWKTHPGAWPVLGLTLGSVFYTQAELLQILNAPVATPGPGANGLVSLAHQLIAAKLNIAQGADPTAASAAITAADAQIGALVVPPIGGGYLSPASTSNTTQILDDYNNGIIGPGHCLDTPTRTATWGKIKALYR
jgi:hypothetical protein